MFPILVLALPSKLPVELIVSMLGLEAHNDILGAAPGRAEKPGWNAGVRKAPHIAEDDATAPAVATKAATSKRGLVWEALEDVIVPHRFFQIASIVKQQSSEINAASSCCCALKFYPWNQDCQRFDHWPPYH